MKTPRFTDELETMYVKCLLYSQPGMGKTYSVKTIPNPKSTVIISAEGGLLSVRKAKIEVWEVEKWSDLTEIVEFLNSPELPTYRKSKNLDPLETLFLDSSTELTKKCCEGVLKERGVILEKRGKALDTMFADQMTIEDWGVAKGRVDRMFRVFRDMPYNIIFTALEHSHQSSETKTDKAMPLMYPQSLSEQIPGYFDEVFRMKQAEQDGKTVRWWETVDDGRQIAKDRLGTLDKHIMPDWSVIFNEIKGAKK